MTSKQTTQVTTLIDGNRTIETTVVEDDASFLEKYVQENFLKTLALLLSGFGLMAIYFYHFSIEYTPVFDLQSAAAVILAAACIGLILLLLMSAMILVPAWLVRELLVDKSRLSDPNYLPKLLFLCFGITFIAFIALCAAFVGIESATWRTVALVSGILLLGIVVHLIGKATGLFPGYGQSAALTFVSYLQFLPIFLYVTFLAQAERVGLAQRFEEGRFLKDAFLADLWIQGAGVYFVVAWTAPNIRRLHRPLSIVAASVVGLFLSAIAGNPGFWGSRVANMTKFGSFYATELTLSAEGCRAVNAGGHKACFGNSEDGFKTCGALIASRLGAETYIKLYDLDAAQKPRVASPANPFQRSVLLPSKEILGMALHDVVGSVGASDPVLLTRIAGCTVANGQDAKTVLALGDEQLFEPGQTKLTAHGESVLVLVAAELGSWTSASWRVALRAHPYRSGNAPPNPALTQARTAAVAASLRSRLPPELGPKVVEEAAASVSPAQAEARCPLTMEADKRSDCLAATGHIALQIVSTADKNAGPRKPEAQPGKTGANGPSSQTTDSPSSSSRATLNPTTSLDSAPEKPLRSAERR